MAKKTVDDDREPVSPLEVGFVKAADFETLPLELQRLIESHVVTHDSGKVSWRMGHLLHIANLYKGDPAKTERDYADDLAVARAYSADVWEALLK